MRFWHTCVNWSPGILMICWLLLLWEVLKEKNELSREDDEIKAQQVFYNLVPEVYFQSTKELRKNSTQKLRYSQHNLLPTITPHSYTNSWKYNNPQYRRTNLPTQHHHLARPKGSGTIYTTVTPGYSDRRRISTPITGNDRTATRERPTDTLLPTNE